MYRDRVQWTKIRRRILVDAVPIRRVVRETGISRKTIRKMLIYPLPKRYGPRYSKEKQATPSFVSAERPVKTHATPNKRTKTNEIAFEWMRSVLQKQIPIDLLQRDVAPCELTQLTARLYDGRLSDRNRLMVVLATHHGIRNSLICRFLGLDRKTVRKYLQKFARTGAAGLFARQTKANRKSDDDALKDAIFGVLHEPPSSYGINRTTWTMAHLMGVLRERGHPVGPGVIRKITRAAGYRWRKARIVLTSNDPAFSEKLARVRSILSKLSADEAFFRLWSVCC